MLPNKHIFHGRTLTHGCVELMSNSIRTNRTCTIQMCNYLSMPLEEPKFYCCKGTPYYVAPQAVNSLTKEACSFAKDRDTDIGVAGLLSYRIGHTDDRFVVVYSVPYNQLQWQNTFGLAIVSQNENDTDDLSHIFQEMYDDEVFFYDDHHGANDRKRSSAHGELLSVKNEKFCIMGKMSERGKSIIKLDIVPYNDVHFE